MSSQKKYFHIVYKDIQSSQKCVFGDKIIFCEDCYRHKCVILSSDSFVVENFDHGVLGEE